MRCFTVTTEPCPPSLPRGPPPGPASRPHGWTHGQTHRWTVPLRQGSSWKPCGRSLPHLNEKHPRARASCPGGSGSVSTCFGAVVRPASAGQDSRPVPIFQPHRAGWKGPSALLLPGHPTSVMGSGLHAGLHLRRNGRRE